MNDLDTMRANALRQIDNAERSFKAAIFGAAIFEGLFLAGILWFADLRNELHLLMLFCTGLVYMPVLLGLVAVGAYVNRCTLRVLARLDES